MTLMLPILLLGMAARWVWGRARRRSDATAERLVCETYERSLDDTQPIDIVDLDRSSREIHHMTVPELKAVNAEFLALMEANFPNQT